MKPNKKNDRQNQHLQTKAVPKSTEKQQNTIFIIPKQCLKKPLKAQKPQITKKERFAQRTNFYKPKLSLKTPKTIIKPDKHNLKETLKFREPPETQPNENPKSQKGTVLMDNNVQTYINQSCL